MSQIGGERLLVNFTRLNRVNNGGEYSFDDYNAQQAVALLIFSISGLLGNSMILLLAIAVTQLQKPQNAFFLHHCLLDAIKSVYTIIFSKSLFDQQPPAECAILGASYIVFVTTSAFNILAITINEIYHFTNKIVGIHIKNKCCVLFGLGMTWFASIIINLGVAFLPGNTTFDKTIGYCTFMYGVTGNYLLHLLWILLITLAMILTIVYLRKFWLDIQEKTYYRMSTLFHHTVQLNIEEVSRTGQLRDHTTAHKLSVKKIIKTAKKNFALFVSMVIVFILFWYPLFILTLADSKFKANPIFYKTLTIIAWCHSATTPVFFLIYNLTVLKTFRNEWCLPQRLKGTVPLSTVMTSSTNSTRSPQRPNSLNVTPSYGCEAHLASGMCKTKPRTKSLGLPIQYGTANSIAEHLATHARNRAHSVGPIVAQKHPCYQFHKHDINGNDIDEKDLTLSSGRSKESLNSQPTSLEKYIKMGSACSFSERAASPIKKHPPTNLHQRINLISLSAPEMPSKPLTYLTRTTYTIPTSSRSMTTPCLYKPTNISRVKTVTGPNPSCSGLTVYRLSTGCLMSSTRLKKSGSDYHLNEHNVDWV